MRTILLLAPLGVVVVAFSGCALDPVSLDNRPCRNYLDCLTGQGFYCQPIDTGDGSDGGVYGICTSLDGSILTMDAGRDAGTDSGRDTGVDAGLDADLDAGSDGGGVDSGETDGGGVDSGEIDGGGVDSGEIDAGGVDSGEIDSGAGDSGVDSGT